MILLSVDQDLDALIVEEFNVCVLRKCSDEILSDDGWLEQACYVQVVHFHRNLRDSILFTFEHFFLDFAI